MQSRTGRQSRQLAFADDDACILDIRGCHPPAHKINGVCYYNDSSGDGSYIHINIYTFLPPSLLTCIFIYIYAPDAEQSRKSFHPAPFLLPRQLENRKMYVRELCDTAQQGISPVRWQKNQEWKTRVMNALATCLAGQARQLSPPVVG